MQINEAVRFACNSLLKRLERARLADSGLADQRDDLALTLTSQAPAVEHQPHLVLAADQRRAAGADRGEATHDPGLAEHAPHRDRTDKSFQFVLACRFEPEQSAEQILRAFADQDRVRCRKRLKSRREIGGLADNGPLLGGAGADDFADHNEPGRDADTGLQARAVRALDVTDFRQDGDRGADRPLRRVLEGAGEAEIGEHAIAHEFGDKAAEPSDRTGGDVLITPDQISQLFGIDFARQRRGANHVAEQYCNLAPLGVRRGLQV